LFVVRTPERAAWQTRLHARGIGTAIHYPVPLHQQPAYAAYGRGAGSLPVAEHAATEVLSLPLYPEMSDEQVERVSAALAGF
jgi:dTDP-3-amino-3,4,6-trideoxy-alpha-D-glucose transaminase